VTIEYSQFFVYFCFIFVVVFVIQLLTKGSLESSYKLVGIPCWSYCNKLLKTQTNKQTKQNLCMNSNYNHAW